MTDSEWLAAAFEEHRDHLRAVAYRLLGSSSDADDAVQDTWLKLTGADPGEVENLGWLADDRRRAGVTQHAPVTPVPARGAGRWCVAGCRGGGGRDRRGGRAGRAVPGQPGG